jgi:polysaccharide biosynthesis/export protein VpsN
MPPWLRATIQTLHPMLSRVRLLLSLLILTFAGVVLPGCGKHYSPPPKLPAPIVNQQVGPGDILSIFVVGEDKLPNEFEVTPDGTLDFPFSKPIKVGGLEPRDIAGQVRDGLIEAKYLQDPQVQVKIKQYNSKKIQIIGMVTRSGPLPYQDGMTLVQAISAAGWFTPLADTNNVLLIRQVPPGKSVSALVSVDAITDNAQPDVKLQQGDTIKVNQRLF